MKVLLFALLLVSSSELLGADVLKVDGQSAASTRQSIEAMKKGMSSAEQKAFADAIYKIRIYNPQAGHDSRLKGPNVLIDDAALGAWIDGMTASQIIKLGSELPEAPVDKRRDTK